MGDVKDNNLKTILANMQSMCEYQAEKIRMYEEHLAELTGKERPELTDSDKRRLAQKGKVLNDYLLASIEPAWALGTIRHWYHTLSAQNTTVLVRDRKSVVGSRFRQKLSPRFCGWLSAI